MKIQNYWPRFPSVFLIKFSTASLTGFPRFSWRARAWNKRGVREGNDRNECRAQAGNDGKEKERHSCSCQWLVSLPITPFAPAFLHDYPQKSDRVRLGTRENFQSSPPSVWLEFHSPPSTLWSVNNCLNNTMATTIIESQIITLSVYLELD